MLKAEPAVMPQWTPVCALDDIVPDTGVTALIDAVQIAVFRVGEDDALYAVSNYDPFSRAYLISRGIVGDLGGELVVASPVYKQHFSLKTGQCLEDAAVSLPTYAVRLCDGIVEVAL